MPFRSSWVPDVDFSIIILILPDQGTRFFKIVIICDVKLGVKYKQYPKFCRNSDDIQGEFNEH